MTCLRLGEGQETLAQSDSLLPCKRDVVPTLTRLIVVIAVIAGLGYGAVFALANLVEPGEREITVRIKKDGFGR